jgi:hypothetical protein
MATRNRSNSVGLGNPMGGTIIADSSDDESAGMNRSPVIMVRSIGQHQYGRNNNDNDNGGRSDEDSSDQERTFVNLSAGSGSTRLVVADEGDLSAGSGARNNRRPTTPSSSKSTSEQLFNLMDDYFQRWRHQTLVRRIVIFLLVWLGLAVVLLALITSLGGHPLTKGTTTNRVIGDVGRSKFWKWMTTPEPESGNTPLWNKALSQDGPYTPKWQSLRTHTLPKWYENGKLGIFIR